MGAAASRPSTMHRTPCEKSSSSKYLRSELPHGIQHGAQHGTLPHGALPPVGIPCMHRGAEREWVEATATVRASRKRRDAVHAV